MKTANCRSSLVSRVSARTSGCQRTRTTDIQRSISVFSAFSPVERRFFCSRAVSRCQVGPSRGVLGPGRGRVAIASMAQTSDNGSSKDLLIVGPGVLGSYLGKRWLELFPEATVLGQTNTTDNHARLEKLGLKARTAKQAEGSEERFPNVVFAAPASGSEDYVADIKKALAIWDGSGAFVFTSSAGTYAANDGSSVDEESPLVPLGTNERNDRQIQGEQAVLEAGGCVVRLVGLYHAQRGAHTFFLKMGKVDRWEGYTVNLIHYQDAASMCIAVLAGDGQDAPHRGRLFVGTDGSPITFKDMMDATLASGAFQGQVEFTAAEGASKGKRVNNDKSRAALGWAPQFASFADFMATTGAKDFYTESGLF